MDGDPSDVDDRPAADRRAAFESALGNEYFALNGLRSSTTSEASTRASIFFTTLTGTLLALGFFGSETDSGRAVAYAAVPMVALLGVLTFLRSVELAVLDVRALQSMQRIRAYWRDLVPEGPDHFPRPVEGQAIDIVLDTGERRGLFRSVLTIAATVGLVDSLWIGASTAFAADDLDVAPAGAVAIGAAVGVLLGLVMFRHQTRRFNTVVGAAPQDA
jgi:hypothetical protein